MASYDQPLDGNIVINNDIDIDLTALADALVANPDFINKLRAALLKDARKLGNSLGQYAQATNPTAANPVRRIQ